LLEELEIYPYQRSGGENKKYGSGRKLNKVKIGMPQLRALLGHVLNAEALAVMCAGFFLGRAVLLGELAPFGAAFVAAAIRTCGRTGLLAVPAVLLGLFTISGGVPLAGSIITIIFIWLLAGLVPTDIKRPWLVLPALVLAATVIVKTSFTAFNDPSSYGYFTVLFEAVFAALLTPVFILSVEALKKKAGGEIHPFSGEEIFCILLLFGGLIAGTGDLRYEMVSVKGIFSRLTVLLAALVGGAGAGAAAGAVVGVIPGLAYVAVPVMVGAYSFSGLLAGICRNFGKAGVATGFLLGNIILSVYISDYGDIIAILAETGIAVLLFVIIPGFLIEDVKGSLGLQPAENVEHQEREFYKEIFKERIKSWSRVFSELSQTFEQVSSSTGQNWEEQGLQKLLNQVGEKVCTNCTFYRTCWEREFYKTYQGLIDVLALVEIYGRISPDNLSDEIKRRCSRTKELAITVGCLYETYNNNRYWSRRLLESREIVSEQLRGISEVMANLPGELEYEVETGEVGPSLRKKLKESGVQVESLTVSRREDGGMEVSLTHPHCGGSIKCADVIVPLLSRLVGRPLYQAAVACTARERESACHLRLYSDLNYEVVLGAAGAGKNGSLISGDSYAFFHLSGGRFALALSDGMGAGPRAALESGTTISLLRHLLESGFGQDLAIKTINSILVLRSPGESFATVDLAVINLYNGQADFVKIGAVPTFTIRSSQVLELKSSSLPVGIVEDIEVSSMNRNMEPGDVLVMVTDGVLDACRGTGDRETWLVQVLKDVAEMPPQEMAELLLKLAQARAGGAARSSDDMTVLVARLERLR